MKKQKIIISLIAIFFSLQLVAQQNVAINTTGAAPAASAILDVSSTDKGLLVPRVALTQTSLATPITAPATSLLVYNTATANDVTPGYYFWDGTQWVKMGSGTGTSTSDCGCLYTDPRDGRQYRTVSINNRCWFADNLRYLPQVWSPADRSSTQARYHVYNYNSNVVAEAKSTPEFFYYGVLYNHQAVLATGANAICPPGWRVPTQSEWDDMKTWIMANTHHTNTIGSATLGSSMKSCRQVNSQLQFGGCNTSDWPRFDSHTTHFGTDDFGLSLIPGGYMDNNGIFNSIHQSARYWTNYNQFTAMKHIYVNYNMGHSVNVQSPSTNANSYCVRCIRIN